MSDSYVHDVRPGRAGLRVAVRASDGDCRTILRSYGTPAILPWPVMWTVNVRDDEELAALFSDLRDIDVWFVMRDFSGWPPADHWERLRDEGLVTGTCKMGFPG